MNIVFEEIFDIVGAPVVFQGCARTHTQHLVISIKVHGRCVQAKHGNLRIGFSRPNLGGFESPSLFRTYVARRAAMCSSGAYVGTTSYVTCGSPLVEVGPDL